MDTDEDVGERTSPLNWVTGTDTGVGKTVFTALMVRHRRRLGFNAGGMKPFCSGSMDDRDAIGEAMGWRIPAERITPYAYPDPVSPMAGARAGRGPAPDLQQVLDALDGFVGGFEESWIEGAGGLLAPLGEGFDLRTLVESRPGTVWIVAPNRVGVQNHVRLTVEALERSGLRRVHVVLMEQAEPDPSSRWNAVQIAELLGKPGVFELPHLGSDPLREAHVGGAEKKFEKNVAAFEARGIVFPLRGNNAERRESAGGTCEKK